MKFSVLALDYDGTIALHGQLDPAVREAIAEVRARGIAVLLVTGRRLDELRKVAGSLHLVDAVVGENGAVLEYPATGYTTVLGEPPPPALLRVLREAGVEHEVGEVVVEASADDGPRILDAIRALELPLVLLYNRGRLMVLPQSVSKATGLRHALRVLRLSPHNAVAIGDGENDHQLLGVCELGVAVAWGSPALQDVADEVLPGKGPAAVADYLRRLADIRELPMPLKTRRRLLLGHGDDGQPFSLAVRGRGVLVAGDTKSGKSWVAGLLCEQLILAGYCLCVLDPEGDYVSLEALPGVTVFGGADPLPRPRDLVRALRHPDASVVIDLSQSSHDEKRDYMRSVLPALASLRQHTGLPHRVVVDEAHYFLHDADVLSLLDLDASGYTLVTYRASQIHPDILARTEAIVVTRESDPAEIRALVDLCARSGHARGDRWELQVGTLAVGEAVVLPMTSEAGGKARRLHLAPRLTPHVRHRAKYIDVPVPWGRAFVFSSRDGHPGERAHTLRAFVEALERTQREVIAGHARRHDFSRWLADVFGDYPLARDVERMEHGPASPDGDDLASTLSRTIRARYEFVDAAPPVNERPGPHAGRRTATADHR